MPDTKIELLTDGVTALSSDRIPATRDPAGTPSNVYLTPEYIRSLGSGSVNVAAAATGGDGTVGDPWTGWDTAVVWAADTTFLFKTGYYAYETSPDYLYPGIQLIGEAGVYLQHTGTGNAFVMDAGSTVGVDWIQNVRVENINVLGSFAAGSGLASGSAAGTAITGVGTAFTTEAAVGNTITFFPGTSAAQTRVITVISSNTSLTVSPALENNAASAEYNIGKSTNGFYLRGVRNGIFKHLSARNVGNAGIWTEACVTNMLENFRVTSHEPTTFFYWEVRPRYGIVTTGRSGDWSTTWTIINPVIEYLWGTGIWFKSDSYGNTIINGTSEGNVEDAIGIQIDGNFNVVTNLDVEANTSQIDFVVAGNYNTFHGNFSQNLFRVDGGSNLIGTGRYQDLNINGGYNNVVINPKVLGTYTDTGTYTVSMAVTGASRLAKLGIVQKVRDGITISAGLVASNWEVADLYMGYATANLELSNPTGLNTHGQIVRYFIYGAGSYTISYGSKWAGKNGVVLPRNIVNNQIIVLEGMYNISDDRVEVVVGTHGIMTVAQLPSAATNPGARSMVSDANATTFLSTVAGGGANIVPVISNGTNWIIG